MIFKPRSIAEEIARLKADHNVVPVMGCELEWYVQAPQDATLIERIHQQTRYPVKAEEGPGQFEACWDETGNLEALAAAVDDFKQRLIDAAHAEGAMVTFAAKPFAGQRGSALQLHIHLEDTSGKRLFEKQGEHLSSYLLHALGGLLETLPEAMSIFAASDSAQARLQPGQDAPTTISWGGNNRTVALRLPMKRGSLCHIEHRVPAADADVRACIAAILCGVHYGLSHRCQPGPQTHGNASDAQYRLTPLIG